MRKIMVITTLVISVIIGFLAGCTNNPEVNQNIQNETEEKISGVITEPTDSISDNWVLTSSPIPEQTDALFKEPTGKPVATDAVAPQPTSTNTPIPTSTNTPTPTLMPTSTPTPTPTQAPRIMFLDYSINLSTLLSLVNDEHKKLAETVFPDKDIAKYTKTSQELAKLLSEQEAKKLLEKKELKNKVTKQQATSDVDIMFRAFKSAYGMYFIFDESEWNTAEKSLNKWVESQKGDIDVDLFGKELQKSLRFIVDGHFEVYSNHRNDQYDNIRKYYYYDYQYEFSEENGQYYIKYGDKRYHFKAFSNGSGTLRPTLSSRGKIVYAPVLWGTISEAAKDTKIMLLSDAGEEIILPINWHRADIVYRTSEIYSMSFNDDLAYVKMSSFSARYEKELLQFVADAEKIKNSKILILDLRGNSGGEDKYIYDWYKALTGYDVSRTTIRSYRGSQLAYARGTQKASIGTFETTITQGKYRKQDRIIFLLVDNNVASSGEAAFETLMTLENVVVIGSNTMGCSKCGNIMTGYLPNSGVDLRFGGMLFTAYNLDSPELIGYKPDIWCEPTKSLEYLKKLLINEELVKQSDLDKIFK